MCSEDSSRLVESESGSGSGQEIFIGWKIFTLDILNGTPRLIGGRGGLWKRRTMVATCDLTQYSGRRDKCEEHLSRRECSCGIYSYKNPPSVDLGRGAGIYAQVVSFGTVLECQEDYTDYTKFNRLYSERYGVGSGYRASKCRIDALFSMTPFPNFIHKGLEHRYKVPLYIGLNTWPGKILGNPMEEYLNSIKGPDYKWPGQ